MAPSRFAALAAAHRARARRAEIAPESPKSLAAYLAPLPVSLLTSRPEVAALPEALERFGIATLGELAALSRAHLADRFGAAGPLARDLARGKDAPLRPRVPSERLEEVLELPESASGPQLERALGMLIDRVLARNERRGRTVRAVVLSAKLVGGGTWRTQMTFREALADPRRMRLAITGRLTSCPRPRTRCACAWRPSARRAAISAPCSPNRPRSVAPACARRSARPGRPPGRTPRCASSPSTPTRACPNAASRSRHGNRDRRARTARRAAHRRAHRPCARAPARATSSAGGRTPRDAASADPAAAGRDAASPAGGECRAARRRGAWPRAPASSRPQPRSATAREAEGRCASRPMTPAVRS